jgi:hypothetical protein
MAEAALAAAAAEWLRQRRRLVSGGLGLCFCGFLAEAAAATETGSAGCGSGGDLCLAASACVSAALWLRQRRRLVSGGLGLCFCGFLAEAAAAMETCACGGSAGFMAEAALAVAAAETCVWLVFLAAVVLFA